MADLEFRPESGLTPNTNVKRNAVTLSQCRNAHPMKDIGCKPLMQVTYPIEGIIAMTLAWPHMQLLMADKTLLLLTATTMYEVNQTSMIAGRVAPNNPEPLWDATNPLIGATISANTNVWQCAGFQQMYFLTNGLTMLWKIPSTPNEADGEPKIVVNDDAEALSVQAVANWNNRLVLAGVTGTNLENAAFTAAWDYWRDNSPLDIPITEDTEIDTSWLIIGGRGGSDNDIPHASLMALLGFPTFAVFNAKWREIVYSAIEEGALSFFPLRNAGGVKRMIQYGNDLIVYGKNSVERMSDTQAGFTQDRISDFGVCGRGGAGGNDRIQLWVSNQGTAHKLVLGSGLTDLDFEPQLGNLTLDDDLLVVHDPQENFFWIGDAADGYCLTRWNTLGRNDALRPTSLLRLPSNDALVGCYLALADPQAMVIESETFDGGPGQDRRIWEAAYVNIGTTDSNATGWGIVMRARLDKGAALTDFASELVDNRGRARVKKSGAELRWRLTNPNYKEADLDSVTVEIGRGKPSMRAWLDA